MSIYPISIFVIFPTKNNVHFFVVSISRARLDVNKNVKCQLIIYIHLGQNITFFFGYFTCENLYKNLSTLRLQVINVKIHIQYKTRKKSIPNSNYQFFCLPCSTIFQKFLLLECKFDIIYISQNLSKS